ncbi:MAG: ABC transporter ATP-binding protein [Candidatus Xenobiia bacterium LiM19]
MSDQIIEMSGICKNFGKQEVLKGMNLAVPKGSIYAFLGRNGEGKSTSIRLMLNLLTAEAGAIKVFGQDVQKHGEQIRNQVGYVPETPHVYDWMTVEELVAFTSAFYIDWDRKRAEELIKSLDIPRKKKVHELSTGTKAKVGLLLALSHNPKLLILDDCTSGLDALVRREISEHIVTLVEDCACTIFFSSHIITELERVADRVGLLKGGSLSFQMPMEELKEKTRKIYICLDNSDPGDILNRYSSSILRMTRDREELTIITKEWNDELVSALKGIKNRTFDVTPLDLEDIFVEYTREKNSNGTGIS